MKIVKCSVCGLETPILMGVHLACKCVNVGFSHLEKSKLQPHEETDSEAPSYGSYEYVQRSYALMGQDVRPKDRRPW